MPLPETLPRPSRALLPSLLLACLPLWPPPAKAQDPEGEGSTLEGSGPDEPGTLVPPVPRTIPEVPYPAGLDAGSQRIEVLLHVSEEGVPTEVEIVSGVEPFASLVLEASKNARFEPAREGGEPVPVLVPLSWEFPAPPVSVAGIVRRMGDRLPVPGLEMLVGPRRVRTDASGSFEVRNLLPGPCRVQIGESSFRLPDTAFEVRPDERVDLELWVVEESWAHEAVGVYRKRPQAILHRSLSHEDIVAAPGALGDPVRALQNEPGLVRTPLDTGWLLVRGGDPEDTAIYLDGVHVPLLFHLGGFTSVLHPEMIERIEFYADAPPARLGRSLSGAVEMEPRRIAGDTRAVAGVNLVWAHAFAEAPLGEESGIALAARRSYLDAVLGLVLTEEQAAIAPRFWDAQARFDSPHFGIFAVGMSDATDAPVGGGDVATITQRSTQVQSRADAAGDAWSVEGRLWVAWQAHEIAAPTREEESADFFPGGRLGFRVRPSKDVEFSLGVTGERHRFRIARDADSRTAPYGHADPYGEISFGKDVRARIGARLTTLFAQDQYARAGFSPRGSLAWQATQSVAFVGAIGIYHQAPSAYSLLADPEGPYLHLERSSGGTAGIRVARGGVGLDVDGWARWMDHLAGLERDASMGQRFGRAYGVDGTLKVERGSTSAQLIYQYGRSLIREERGDGWEPTMYDQPHRCNAVVVQRLPRAFSIAMRWRYGSGFSSHPDAPTAFDILTQQEIEVAVDAHGRLMPYHALDLKVSRRFTWKAWRLDAYVDVQNVYGRRIPEPAINGFDESLIAYGFGLPTLPIFGIDGVFWP